MHSIVAVMLALTVLQKSLYQVSANLASKEHTFFSDQEGTKAQIVSYDDDNTIMLNGEPLESPLSKFQKLDLEKSSEDNDVITSTGFSSVTTISGGGKIEQWTSREHAGSLFAIAAAEGNDTHTNVLLRCAKDHEVDEPEPPVLDGPTGQSKSTPAYSCLGLKQIYSNFPSGVYWVNYGKTISYQVVS